MSKATNLARDLLTNPACVLSRIMSVGQRRTVLMLLRGEEGEWFAEKMVALSDTYAKMPVTYSQDGKGDDAMVYLHYFRGGIDAWITERDMSGLPEVGDYDQSYGLQSLGGGIEQAGMGYISLIELAESGVEMDFHFTPCTVGELKKKRR